MLRNFEGHPRRSSIFQYLPLSFSAYCIKGLSKVNESDVKSLFLLTAFLLKLAKYKHHVCSDSVGSEAALGFREMVLTNSWDQSIEEIKGLFRDCLSNLTFHLCFYKG